MEKQTTFKSCKNRMAAAIMTLCFMSVAFAQNLQTTLGESWTGSAWENAYQSENTYDGNNHLVGTLSQVWIAPPGEWVNAIKSTYTNNPAGAPTQILIEMWDSDSSAWMLSQRVTNTLNGSNQVLTSISEIWIGTGWINVSKQTNTYGGGYLTVTLMETWNFMASDWDNSTLTNYTNNANGSVNQAVHQTWDAGGSVWVNSSRSTFTYNGADQMLTELEEAWVDAAWQNERRTTNSYNSGGLFVSLTEIWIQDASFWQNETQSLYTNNSGGTPIQIIVQDWSFGGDTLVFGAGFWVNAVRITFTYDSLGVADLSKNGVVLYPNPAHDYITIKSDTDYLNAYSIVDQQGRTIQVGTLSGFESSVDISSLPSGIFFFQLVDGRKATVKLIKH